MSSMFLSATQIFQWIMMLLYSSKQAVRCSLSIRCLVASHETHEARGKQLSQLFHCTIEANLKSTEQLNRLSLLSSFCLYLPISVYDFQEEDLKHCLRNVHPSQNLWL